jgi:DNA-binding CsgD family transcriptional regulator
MHAQAVSADATDRGDRVVPKFQVSDGRIDGVTHREKLAAARLLRGLDGDGPPPDDIEIGLASPARSRMASEIGAAMAHELNGPMTALLLYVGDIHQKKHRINDSEGDTESLRRVVESAFREAERICALIHRMSDYFEAPITREAAIPAARGAIAWWSRTGSPDGRSPTTAADRAIADFVCSRAKALTPREREVLRLVSQGYSNKEGGKQMNISYRTFECHRAEVMRKLGAKNTAELVRLALQDRAVSCAPEPCST